MKKIIFLLLFVVLNNFSVKAETPYYLDFKFILNQSDAGKKTQDFLKKRPLWVQLGLFLIGISGIILTFIINQNNVRPFIYFQF